MVSSHSFSKSMDFNISMLLIVNLVRKSLMLKEKRRETKLIFKIKILAHTILRVWTACVWQDVQHYSVYCNESNGVGIRSKHLRDCQHIILVPYFQFDSLLFCIKRKCYVYHAQHKDRRICYKIEKIELSLSNYTRKYFIKNAWL